MRILAIRGKNLASLAGTFELHFHQSPLATAGLFAICGPTGSGKSTLLDALCLALYDETPRLNRAAVKGVSLPDVGEDTITPQDSRNLLRRGAGEGFAEVDFIGNDHLAYRARWSVRRARGKANGKLQNTELLLQTLDGGQTIGGVKTEVQQAIRERLGLTFEQFTRAVLLAQNEFAAFLKADKDQCAGLLETLTGLGVYTEISIRTFERAKREQNELERLNDLLAGQQPLDDAARVVMEQALTVAKTEMAMLEQHKIALDQQQQWHERWQKLQQDEQQAHDVVQKVYADQQSAGHRQQQLAQIEAVQEARPAVNDVDRTITEVTKNRQIVLNAEAKQEEAQRLHQHAETAKIIAAQAFTEAQQKGDAANATLQQARNLDAQINTLIPGHNAATKTLSEARQAEAEVQKSLKDKQAERQQVAQQLQTAQEWLTKYQALHILAEDWPRWDEVLKHAAVLQNQCRDVEQHMQAGQRDAQDKRQTLDQAINHAIQTEKVLQIAQARLQTALDELTRFDSEALATQRQIAQMRRDQLTEAERLWIALHDVQARHSTLENESHALEEKAAQAKAALTQLLADQPAAIARLEQAEKSLKTAEAACAKNVETLRANLETDEPCPVCGATTHPYAMGNAPSHALLASFTAEVAECRKALENLRTQETAQRAHHDNHCQRRTRLVQEQASLTAAMQRNHAAWNAQPLAAELTTIAPADRPAWFIDQQQRAQRDLATIAQQEDAQRKVAKQRNEAQTARDQAQKQHSTAQNALNMAQHAFDQATQTLQITQNQQADLVRQLQERLTLLDAAFSGYHWRPLWQADPVGFHEARRQKVSQWNEQRQKAEQWQNQLGALDIAIHSQTATVADKAAQRQRAAETFQAINDTLQTKRQQRQTLFGGQPVKEVEAQFVKMIEEARLKHQQHDQAVQAAAQAQVIAKTTLQQAQQTLTDCEQATAQATVSLQQWITYFNARHPDTSLDISKLRTLLTYDHAWLNQERAALQALADAVKGAETILKERQAQREYHEQQRTHPDSAEAVQVTQQKTQADWVTAQNRTAEMEITLRQDNQRRVKTQDLQKNIAQQQAITQLWNQLNELIGSADGKKFRNHAQQFTLDVLLGYANRHLADVSRRYRLERVKDTLALMVVDQDMGDERRSVHSLSGGESFLVSLALALGLASLSSNRVCVESLFIDEGFGSLDSDTLRIAMDALDHLQAQGRKVGVISHVPEMTERIGVQIHVQRQSGGQSRVEVRGI